MEINTLERNNIPLKNEIGKDVHYTWVVLSMNAAFQLDVQIIVLNEQENAGESRQFTK